MNNLSRLSFDVFFNKEQTKGNKGFIKKISLDGTEYFLCFDKENKKKFSSSDIKKISIYTAYLETIGKDRGYWWKDGENHYIELSKDKQTYNIEGVYESEECDEDESRESAESFFSLKDIAEIELSVNEVIKEFGEDNTKALAFLLIMTILVVSFLYLNSIGFFADQIEKRKKPVRPNYPPLTVVEKTYLKHKASLVYLKSFLLKIVEEYKKDTQLFKKERRTTFSSSYYDDVIQVSPTYNEDLNAWVYLDGEFPKRGGVKISISSTILNSFLSKGTVYAGTSSIDGKSYFTRNKLNYVYLDERNITREKRELLREPSLSYWCLDNVLHIGNLNTGGIKRGENYIELKVDEANPKDFIPRVYNIAKKCDGLFLYNTEISEGKVSTSMKIMYSTKENKK